MGDAFLETQRRAFEQADQRHFEWQVTNPFVCLTERQLLHGFLAKPVERMLEVGSGEGANLVNLRTAGTELPPVTVAMDLFVRKASFGQRHAAPARFVCGDALSLPFASGAFDLVLCRDLLHHLQDRPSALRELRRVCRPGGEVWVIEPNGRNPLIALWAMAFSHERGQLQTTPGRLRAQASAIFGGAELEMRQPLPIARALVHYSLGRPALARKRWFQRAMAGWDKAWAALLPRRLWAYIVLRIVNQG